MQLGDHMSLLGGRRIHLACYCLLALLMLTLLEVPCYAYKGKDKGGYPRTEMDTAFKFHGNFKGNGNQNFEDVMRKTTTGESDDPPFLDCTSPPPPNPLRRDRRYVPLWPYMAGMAWLDLPARCR